MSSIFVYLPDLSSSITSGPAALPNLLVETFTPDIVFQTTMSISVVQNVFQFTKNGDNLYIFLTNNLHTFGGNESFTIENATYDKVHSGSNIPYNALTAYQTANAADGVATLADDFLGYLAHNILGSQNLVGAFANPRDNGNLGEGVSAIIDHWTQSVYEQMSSATYTQINDESKSNYFIAGFENLDSPAYVNPTTSLLWDIYSAVLAQQPSRIINATDSVPTDLFAVGDVMEIEVNIAPALDATITLDNGATSITTPDIRKYGLRITFVE